MRISAVIPTRNRRESLVRTLLSLAGQTHPLEEILVVDASDVPLETSQLPASVMRQVSIIHSDPSVCRQRNIGIGRARGEYTLLCDDDIELAADYVELLAAHILEQKAIAVTGLVHQQTKDGRWVYQYPVSSLRRLLWTYVFQLGVWGEITYARPRAPASWLHDYLVRRYAARGNSISSAGWPVITRFDGTVIRTRVYGLGAAIIETAWLCSHAFDETLDPHGIGDNYGIAIRLPDEVHVLKAACAYHHVSPINRLPPDTVSFRRVLALDYFSALYATKRSRLFLLWSLMGMLVGYVFADVRSARATLKAMFLIAFGRNPYSIARAQGRKFVAPVA